MEERTLLLLLVSMCTPHKLWLKMHINSLSLSTLWATATTLLYSWPIFSFSIVSFLPYCLAFTFFNNLFFDYKYCAGEKKVINNNIKTMIVNIFFVAAFSSDQKKWVINSFMLHWFHGFWTYKKENRAATVQNRLQLTRSNWK